MPVSSRSLECSAKKKKNPTPTVQIDDEHQQMLKLIKGSLQKQETHTSKTWG